MSRGSSWKRILWTIFGRRRTARRALSFITAELGIDWPVELVWRKDLPSLGQVRGADRHRILLHPDQGPEELERTIFHEAFHLAQFHKWGTLPAAGRLRRLEDLELAEALAELYSQVTSRGWRRSGRPLPATPLPAPTPRRAPLPAAWILPVSGSYRRWAALTREEEREVLSVVERRRPV